MVPLGSPDHLADISHYKQLAQIQQQNSKSDLYINHRSPSSRSPHGAVASAADDDDDDDDAAAATTVHTTASNSVIARLGAVFADAALTMAGVQMGLSTPIVVYLFCLKGWPGKYSRR